MKRLPRLWPLAFGLLLLTGMPRAFGQERKLDISCDAKPIPHPKIGSDREIDVGTEYVGKISDRDPRDKVRGSPCHICVLTLDKGKTYLIDMKGHGTGTDPYLLLEDNKGRHLDSDDDSGGQVLYGGKNAAKIARLHGSEPLTYIGSAQDARITFPCKITGQYRIIASTYDGQGGEYWLQVTTMENEDEYDRLLLQATRYLMVEPAMLKITADGDEDKDIKTKSDALHRSIKYFQKALTIHKSAEVFRDLGTACTNLARPLEEDLDPSECLKWYEAAKKHDMCAVFLNENDEFSWYHLGTDYGHLARMERKAAATRDDAAKKNAAEKAKGYYKKAIESFTAAIEREKENIFYGPTGPGLHPSLILDDYYRVRGKAHELLGNVQKDLKKDMEAREEYRKALEDYDEAVRWDPTDAKNAAARAALYWSNPYGMWNEENWRVVNDYKMAVRLAKEDLVQAGKDVELAKLASSAKELYRKKGGLVPETLDAYLGKEPEYFDRPGYQKAVLAEYMRAFTDKKKVLAEYLDRLRSAESRPRLSALSAPPRLSDYRPETPGEAAPVASNVR